MNPNKMIALGAATAALVFTLSAGALAAGGTTVKVEIEGKSKTLLAETAVTTHAGSITKGGAPAGKCPATSAQGALDAATKHRWTGTFSKSFGSYFVTKILGDTESGKHSYWEIFVNDVPATAGACAIKLHHGDRLLFAAVPSNRTVYPTEVRTPAGATVGQPLTVTVVWFNARGKPSPLAHAKVNGLETDSQGRATFTPSQAGKLVLQASEKGYIRSPPVTVAVTG